MSKIVDIYKENDVEGYKMFTEEELFKQLELLGLQREIKYIESFGGKEKYENALRIQNDEISKQSTKVTKLNINNKKLKEIKRCKLVKRAAIGLLVVITIGTASYLDNKYNNPTPSTNITTTVDYKDYVKLYYFVQEGDTFESISEKFDTQDIKSPIIPNTFVELITDEARAKAYLAELHNIPMGYIYYKVKQYETPASIAEGFYISRTQLWIDNNMKPGQDFYEGQMIKIGVYSLNQVESGPKFHEVEISFEKLLELKEELLNSSLEPVTTTRAK